MSSYNDHLYTFFTEEENFVPFAEMKEHYEVVRQKLLFDFWKEVEFELKKTISSEWDVWLSDDVMDEYSRVGYYHKDYYRQRDDNASFEIIFERLSGVIIYGLWFNRGQNVQSIDFTNISNNVKQLHPNWKAGSSGWWFAARKDTGDNFNKASDLVKILPKNRVEVVKNYVNLLLSAREELGDTAIKFGKKFD